MRCAQWFGGKAATPRLMALGMPKHPLSLVLGIAQHNTGRADLRWRAYLAEAIGKGNQQLQVE